MYFNGPVLEVSKEESVKPFIMSDYATGCLSRRSWQSQNIEQ